MKYLRLLCFFCALLFGGCADKVITTVRHFDEPDNWQFKQSAANDWMPAEVPGLVQLDLFRNGKAVNSIYSDNGTSLEWIAETDWTYKAAFTANDSLLSYRFLDLIFEGVDTYSEIFVNDSLAGTTDNMFREYRFNIRPFLKLGENVISVQLYSPLKRARKEAAKLNYKLPMGNDTGKEKLASFIRKSAYQFGWDWMPRMVTIGIWRNVHLSGHDGVYISGVHISTVEIADTCAWLRADLTIESSEELANGTVTIHDGFKQFKIKKGSNIASVKFRILNPELWWPNSIGKPTLYHFTGKLFINGYLVDSIRTQTGIRTISLFRDDDEYGRSFYFQVNGLPVFMKGANLVPPDPFLTQKSDSEYVRLASDAYRVGMNMIRVWGGGAYAPESFYNACDSLGILVWQDLMFANGMYPADSGFVSTVKQEIVQQGRRISNHPSLAIWCGNNEADVAWKNWGWQKEFQLSADDSAHIYNNYNFIFKELIPDLLEETAPGTPYIESSPLSNWGKSENFNYDNMHYWGVWHGEEAIDSFRVNVPRFMTEYGMQSWPSIKTLAANAIDASGISAAYIQRLQQSYKGNGLLNRYITERYGPVSGVAQMAYLSQLAQRDALQIAIESHRKNSRFCMGTLYWQLNDAWDGASWSTIEHNGTYKAAHYHLKRLYAPEIVLTEEVGDSIQVYFQTDRMDGAAGIFKAEIMDFKGRILSSYERPVNAGYLTAQLIYQQDISKLVSGKSPGDYFLRNSITVMDTLLAENIHFFKKPVELNLPEASISMVCEKSGSNIKVTLTSSVLAKDVFVNCEKCNSNFSDNFFTLLPQVPKTIFIVGESLEAVEASKIIYQKN